PLVAQRALMFVLVCIGWVFFRAPTFSAAADWFAGLVGMHGLIVARPYLARLALLVGAATAISVAAPNAYELRFDAWSISRRATLGFATAIAFIMMNFSSKFLYFQF